MGFRCATKHMWFRAAAPTLPMGRWMEFLTRSLYEPSEDAPQSKPLNARGCELQPPRWEPTMSVATASALARRRLRAING